MNSLKLKLAGITLGIVCLNCLVFSKELTLLDYNKVKKGMTVSEVHKILGKPQRVFSGAKKVGVTIIRHAWLTDKGGSIIIIFHDGKVYSKSQFSLPEVPSNIKKQNEKKKIISINGLWKNISSQGTRSCIIMVQDGKDLYVNGYEVLKNMKLLWHGKGKRKGKEVLIKAKYVLCPKAWTRTRVYTLTIKNNGKILEGMWSNKKGETGNVKWSKRGNKRSKTKNISSSKPIGTPKRVGTVKNSSLKVEKRAVIPGEKGSKTNKMSEKK